MSSLVFETSVTVNNNSPIQDYVHLDDQTQPTFEITPGFKLFHNLCSVINFWNVHLLTLLQYPKAGL